MIPDLISLQAYDQLIEPHRPTTETGILEAAPIKTGGHRFDMPVLSGAQTIERPILEQPDQRDPTTDSWQELAKVTAPELADPNLLVTTSSSGSLKDAGGQGAELGRATEDSGVDLGPQIRSRDQVEGVGSNSMDQQDQSAETVPKTDDGIRDHVESLSPELAREPALETGSSEASIRNHSFDTPPSDRFEQQIEPAESSFQHATFAQTYTPQNIFAGSAEHAQSGLLVPDAQLAVAPVAVEGRVHAPTAGSTYQVAEPETSQGAEITDLSAFYSVSSDRSTSVKTIADLERESAMEEKGRDNAEELDLAIDVDRRLPSPVKQSGAGDSVGAASRARSPKTEKQYEVRVRMIWRNSVEFRSTDPQQPVVVTPLEVTQDFIASRAHRSENTWALYRSALLWHLFQRRRENNSYEESYYLLSGAKALTAPGAKTKKPQKKTISEDHLNQVIDTLGGMNRHVNWGSRTQFWVQAGIGSGLRPGEWFGASWLDETQTVLCIPNGKRKTTVPIFSIVAPGQTIHDVEANNPELLKPGSASDETKRIRNVEIDSRDKIWVNLHMGALNAYLDKVPEDERKNRFINYYNMCRKVLYLACLRTFDGKKQYPLYCMRSQYAANMKAEMPLADVSARMGHERSGKTTKKDYGPRSAAHGGWGVPTPLEQQAGIEARRSRAADARTGSKHRQA